jgi:hypothetical protein
MAEIPTLYKSIIPDEYKFNISKSRIKFTNAELPTLPILNIHLNALDTIALSNSHPYYVCEGIVEFYNDETTKPSIAINALGTYTFIVNVNLDANYEKYFRFVRLCLLIDSYIYVLNNYFNGNATIKLKVNVKCGSNSQCNASTVIKTLSTGQNTEIKAGTYYYDFIYDTKLNSLSFEKKVF